MSDPEARREARAEELQRWLVGREIVLPETPRRMYSEILNHLLQACNEGLLATPSREIGRLVQLSEEVPEEAPRGAVSILGGLVGGPKNFRRELLQDDRGQPLYFERDDGAWFDFAFVVKEEKRRLTLLGYNFEIRFDASGERWFRVDLNLPTHNNESRALRAHCHPAGHGKDTNRSWAVAYPLLSHLELLDLFVCGFRVNEG